MEWLTTNKLKKQTKGNYRDKWKKLNLVKKEKKKKRRRNKRRRKGGKREKIHKKKKEKFINGELEEEEKDILSDYKQTNLHILKLRKGEADSLLTREPRCGGSMLGLWDHDLSLLSHLGDPGFIFIFERNICTVILQPSYKSQTR